MPNCTHIASIGEVVPSSSGCEDCLAAGRRDWVHLRVCQQCGHVGCCDNSPGKHATGHSNATSHPIVRSYEPAEDWYWCYVDEAAFELEGAPPPRPIPESACAGVGRTAAWKSFATLMGLWSCLCKQSGGTTPTRVVTIPVVDLTAAEPTTRVLHPGEGGYDEALAEWDAQQNPDREPAVSTATGRQEAMTLLHAVATSADHAVASAVEALSDPEATGEALRHVLVGGVHSVEDFSAETAKAAGSEPLPAHEATKIIGEVLAELD